MARRSGNKSVRGPHVAKALGTWNDLNEIITELTHDEVMVALFRESEGRRRVGTIRRLIQRAAHITEQRVKEELTRRYLS